MLFIEIRLTLTVSMLGILIAHATWPCLVHIDWTPFILAFVAILILCMFSHMLRSKCWSYLCHYRQRLRSMSSEHKRPLRIVRIIWASLVVWSVAYALASALLGCRTPWWPGLIVPMWSLIYTVSICSTSCSSSEEPESSNENALESGSASSKRSSLYSESSNGNSSSDEES